MTRAELEALLGNTNVQAFLRVIREGESSQDDRAYFMRYTPRGTAYIDSLMNGHPRIFEPLPDGSGRKSSAAGCLQFTATSWDYISQKYGLEDDFSRRSQELHGVALLYDCGAIPAILNGDLQGAVAEAKQHWASLPGSPLQDGGSKVKWSRIQSVWDQYAGAPVQPVEEQPAAPIRESVPPIYPPTEEEKPMAPAVLIALGTQLLKLLPAFSSGSPTANRNIEMTQELGGALVNIAKKLVPDAANEQAAVDKVLNDRALGEQFTAQAAVQWSDVAPFIEAEEKSRADARNFMMEMTSDGPMWRAIGYGVLVGLTAIIIIVGGGWMLWQATNSQWATDAMRQENQAFLRNVVLIVVGFLFGSSYSSHRKDAAREREGR